MKSRCRQALAFSENRRSAAIFCFYRAPIMRGTRVASAIRSVWEAPFSALTQRGARTASAYSSLTGGVFFTEIQRGVALCGAREFAAPAAGAKRKDNLRFSFLFGHGEICRAETRKGTAKDFSSVSFSTVSQCQIPDCYTGGLISAGCGITVPHKLLTCCVGRHLRS